MEIKLKTKKMEHKIKLNGKHNLFIAYKLIDVMRYELSGPVLDFAKNYVITMRPYLLFVSGITGIAGLALSPAVNIASVILLSFCFFLTYGFGQALTDCFQTDTDSISSPYRPLVSGKISRKGVFAVSLTGLSAIGAVVLSYSFAGFVLAVIASLGLATYTPFKRRWWGGPFYNAWIVAALFTIAYLCFTPLAEFSFNVKYAGALAAVFFGYANFVLTGYYKDISADRETGYNTFPVVFGMKASSVVSDIFALLMTASWFAVMYSTGFFTNPAIFAVLLSVSGLTVLVYSQIMLHKVKDERYAYKAISPDVHAYILIIGSIAANARHEWGTAICLFYCGYVITLKLRPMKEQI